MKNKFVKERLVHQKDVQLTLNPKVYEMFSKAPLSIERKIQVHFDTLL